MKIKQNIISFILGMAIMLPVGTYATTQIMATLVDVPVIVDGTEVDTTVYNIDGKNYTSVRDVVEAMGGTVEWKNGKVQIETPKTDLETVVKNCKNSCVMVYVYKGNKLIGNGSGWLYESSSGSLYVITAKHVANAGDKLVVYTDDAVNGATAQEIVDLGTTLDISALKVKTAKPAVKLGDSSKLTEGERLVSITSPDGIQNSIDECLYTRTINVDKSYLQISESKTKGGSSGGAIFNYDSELVGMMIQGEGTTQLAIPVNDIKPILKKLK